MGETSIEWATDTWNPTTGCDRISTGCDNCYALSLAARLKAMGSSKYQADGDPRTSGTGFGLTLHPNALDLPRKWRKPRMVFVNSMSDLFHAKVPLSFIRDVFAVIAETPQHTYQVLTKRALHMRRLSDQLDWPANLWMGVSVENQVQAGRRIVPLLQTGAAVRFISAEPLLGPLDLEWCDGVSALSPDWAGGPTGGTGSPHPLLDWVICGGESGPDARPVDPEWVRSIRDQCEYARVPFFFKQWGVRTPKAGGRLLDGREWSEYPQRVIDGTPSPF